PPPRRPPTAAARGTRGLPASPEHRPHLRGNRPPPAHAGRHRQDADALGASEASPRTPTQIMHPCPRALAGAQKGSAARTSCPCRLSYILLKKRFLRKTAP